MIITNVSEKQIKEKAICYNKRGEPLIHIAGKIPKELYDVFIQETIENGLDETKNLIRILKKYYRMK